jgi:hypothetical protein
MRKLRADEVVEICDRGEYRLTQKGGSAVQKWLKEGWPTKERAHTEKPRKKDARLATRKAEKLPSKFDGVGKAKKEAKPAKKEAKPAKKEAKPAKKEAKVVAIKVSNKKQKKVESKSPEKAGNTKPTEKTEDAYDHQLAF